MNQDIYKNITVITAGFLALGFIFKIDVLLYIAGGVSIGSVLIPPLAQLINWLWLKLALGLGWFNSRVLLSIVYFIFLIPIALISRIFKRDSLGLDRKEVSYYAERNHSYKKEDLENIW